jgi:hypothetical protein
MRRTILALSLPLFWGALAAPQCVATSKNFTAEGPTPHVAESLANDAERAKERFCREFLLKDPGEYPTRTHIFLRAAPPDWLRDNAWVRDVSPLHKAIEIQGHSPYYGLQVIGHEVAHVCLGFELGGPANGVDRWLSEGLAIYFETTIEGYPHRYNDECSTLPLAEFLKTRDIPGEVSGDAYYGQSYSVVRYICDHFGRETLIPFYQMGKSASWEAAAHNILHVELKQLDADWRASLRRWDSPYPRRLRGTKL